MRRRGFESPQHPNIRMYPLCLIHPRKGSWSHVGSNPTIRTAHEWHSGPWGGFKLLCLKNPQVSFLRLSPLLVDFIEKLSEMVQEQVCKTCYLGSSPKLLSSKYPSDGMVDILRLERSAERHRGSSPLLGTKFNLKKLLNYLVV